MIDFETICARAHGTSAVLSDVQLLDVVCGETAAVGCHAGAAIIDPGNPERFDPLGVGSHPSLKRRSGLFAIVLTPALHFCAVAGRVFRSPIARPLGFKSRVARVVAFNLGGSAHDAEAIRCVPVDPMSMRARFAGVVARLSCILRGLAERMRRSLLHPAEARFAGALSASIVSNVSLGKVSFTARLAGEVKALAGRYRSQSLRKWSHVPTTFNSLVVGGLS